jgi:hypothetical protein
MDQSLRWHGFGICTRFDKSRSKQAHPTGTSVKAHRRSD